MTNAELLRLKIKQYKKETGSEHLTPEQREKECRAWLDSLKPIREQNKGLDLIGSYREVRKGYLTG